MTRLKRAFRWIASHKLLTLLLVILIFFLIQVATIPWFGVPRLKQENPKKTALMLQRIDEAEAKGKTLVIRQSWVPLSRLPKHLTDAIIVAEDGTFYEHEGFDWFEVRESLEKNIRERRAARGGSTITQQLAKNLYLSTSKDPLRKAREMVITMLLEQSLSKQRILELYVNLIEWGDGIFGVDAAARRYFGRPASALSFEQSLRLAAVIPSPIRHRPDVDSRYVMRRSEIIRRRMEGRRFVPFPADVEAEERMVDEVAPQALPDTMQAGPGDAGTGDAGTGDAGTGGISVPAEDTSSPARADSAGGGEGN
jgi:monofunctional biosynthetic peptidoglycan transglycosylase